MKRTAADRIRLFAVFIWIALLLCGCVRAETEVEYNVGSSGSVQEISPTPEAPVDHDLGLLRISELMAKNHATLPDRNGEFHDWVEIENISDHSVELSGWSLGDKRDKGKWSFPDMSLGSGEFCIVYCGSECEELSTAFSVSEDESIRLFTPAGNLADSIRCISAEADVSFVHGEDGEAELCRWPTPGLPNTGESYDLFAASHQTDSPLIISEVMSANNSVLPFINSYFDWVELRNVSAEPIELSEYYLSDDSSELHQWQFPRYTLKSGKSILVYCTHEPERLDGYIFHADFELDGLRDELYLSTEDGLVDFVSIHDVPLEGSLCRSENGGFVYCVKPTPGKENAAGAYRVSKEPVPLTPDGVFNGVESVAAALSAEGVIHYTLDGSIPTEDSAIYTEPIVLTKTTVLRAVSVEEGCAVSRPITQSFLLNENHSLPVISLATDSPAAFRSIYYGQRKWVKLPASVSLYEDGESFTIKCGVSMKGWTSLNDQKKNLSVSFGGRFGSEALRYDVFDNGIDCYTDLSIRAGQDQYSAVIRNELCQELCLDMSESTLTQESKACVLYINGKYWGIYYLKEELNRQFYATHANVRKESVTNEKAPFNAVGSFYEDVLSFVYKNDLSDDENYAHICSVIDIDSFIDWVILESFCVNTDTQGNLRVYRSDENDGLWRFAFYDLDWSFLDSTFDFRGLYYGDENCGYELPALMRNLFLNAQFRERFLTRFAEVNRGVLSNESVLRKIDELASTIEPEMPRDRERWGLRLDRWYSRLETLRSFITRNTWDAHNREQLRRIYALFGMSSEEFYRYFE